jgi:hypothetical protein
MKMIGQRRRGTHASNSCRSEVTTSPLRRFASARQNESATEIRPDDLMVPTLRQNGGSKSRHSSTPAAPRSQIA